MTVGTVKRLFWLLVFLVSACVPAGRDVTVTPRPGTATVTQAGPAPTPTPTPAPTAVPSDAIGAGNLDQVRLLHEYWLLTAQAVNADPYEMDISAVALSPDGRLLAVGGCTKPLEADLRSGNVYCGGAAPESAGALPFLLVLDVEAESVIQSVPENMAADTIADLAFNSSGDRLIYAVHPGRFAVWDLESERIESVLWEGPTSAPRLAVSPDDRWAALKLINQVMLRDAHSGEFAAELPGYFRPQFSADGSRVSVFHNTEFIVFETGTWEEVTRFRLPCECVYALSPDLSLLAVSPRSGTEGADAPTQVWDMSTGDQVAALRGGRGWTGHLAFQPDGSLLWRAGERGDLTAWDTERWGLQAEDIGGLTPILNLRGFQFAGDGRRYMLFSYLHLGVYGLP